MENFTSFLMKETKGSTIYVPNFLKITKVRRRTIGGFTISWVISLSEVGLISKDLFSVLNEMKMISITVLVLVLVLVLESPQRARATKSIRASRKSHPRRQRMHGLLKSHLRSPRSPRKQRTMDGSSFIIMHNFITASLATCTCSVKVFCIVMRNLAVTSFIFLEQRMNTLLARVVFLLQLM